MKWERFRGRSDKARSRSDMLPHIGIAFIFTIDLTMTSYTDTMYLVRKTLEVISYNVGTAWKKGISWKIVFWHTSVTSCTEYSWAHLYCSKFNKYIPTTTKLFLKLPIYLMSLFNIVPSKITILPLSICYKILIGIPGFKICIVSLCKTENKPPSYPYYPNEINTIPHFLPLSNYFTQ